LIFNFSAFLAEPRIFTPTDFQLAQSPCIPYHMRNIAALRGPKIGGSDFFQLGCVYGFQLPACGALLRGNDGVPASAASSLQLVAPYNIKTRCDNRDALWDKAPPHERGRNTFVTIS